ncbi:MAG: transglutaminase TgpA family protein [Aeromicrobium sp.]
MLRAEPPSLRSRLSRRPATADWRQSLALLAALALLCAGFDVVVDGGDWWTTAVSLTALVLATCMVLRALGSPLVWLGGLVVWLGGLVWIFAPGTLFAVFPTPSTIGAFYDLWVDARKIILAESAPVVAARPIVFVVAASFALLAIVLDGLQLGLRRPVLVGSIFAAMFAVPTAVSGDKPNVFLFLGVAASWLYLLRAERRQRGGAALSVPISGGISSVSIAVAALAISVALPLALPQVSNIAVSWGRPPPGVFERGINPILQLGQNLRRNTPVTALEYTTTMDQPPYLKVANLMDFNGKSWRPNDDVKYGRIEGNIGLRREVDRKEVTTRISIRNLSSPRLPVPYPGIEVDGLKGQWRWEPQGLTLKSDSTDSRDQNYKVTSLQIKPTRTQMRASVTVIGPTLRRTVALPADMPGSIARTAREVTRGDTNDYDKAVDLQNYFRDGKFAYSETAPVAEGYDGNGVDVIAEFLKVKRGYCVHFSSAMTVMARTLDIPARIAVGYAPGVEVGTNKAGKSIFEATSNDLHAWPELYFEGIGWVQFEPTPGVGNATAFTDSVPGEDVTTDPDSGVAPDSGTTNQPDRSLIDSAPTTAVDDTSSTRSLLVVLAGFMLVLLLPTAIRQVLRIWRLRPAGRSASRLWVELENTARDFGLFVTASETPRAFARHVSSWPALDDEALGRMLEAVERERFGPPGAPVDDIGDFRVVIASLRAGATRGQRLRAALLPRSIFGQATYASRPRLV